MQASVEMKATSFSKKKEVISPVLLQSWLVAIKSLNLHCGAYYCAWMCQIAFFNGKSMPGVSMQEIVDPCIEMAKLLFSALYCHGALSLLPRPRCWKVARACRSA